MVDGRKMTEEERRELERRRIEAGAVGRNVVACECGRLTHFPNGVVFKNCLFVLRSCDWCSPRSLEYEHNTDGEDGWPA